jgi:flagellar hook protein FlgE
MNRSFYNGISGIKTHQFGLDVWAGNISNVNKVGFKTSTPQFSTVMTQSLTSLPTTPVANELGLGSRAAATNMQFQQGAITKTENPFDLALNGQGWFGVSTPNGEQLYTRAGLFNRDSAGYLVDAGGNFLLGTPTGNIVDSKVISDPKQEVDLSDPTAQAKILLDNNVFMPAIPTTQIDFKGALNAKPIYTLTADKERVEAPNKENFQSMLINPDGTQNRLVIDLTKVVPQAVDKTVWDAKATIYDGDDQPLTTQDGQLTFNDRGALVSTTLTSLDNNGTPVALNFGSSYDPATPNSGFDGLFSYHGEEDGFTKTVHQNGKKSGKLLDYAVHDDGTVTAAFDNGASIPVAKIAVYHFQNSAGLEQSSPVYFKQTANSGTPLFFKDKNGKTIDTTKITPFALEKANISMGTALTELIVMQKAFDASAKSITTSDELIQNAINMKQ